MNSETQSNWVLFLIVCALIFAVALSINLYHLFYKDKSPVSATSVRSNIKQSETVYIIRTADKYY